MIRLEKSKTAVAVIAEAVYEIKQEDISLKDANNYAYQLGEFCLQKFLNSEKGKKYAQDESKIDILTSVKSRATPIHSENRLAHNFFVTIELTTHYERKEYVDAELISESF